MNNIETPLAKVSAKVLEDWGMMMVDRMPPTLELFETPGTNFIASIRYEGPFSGTLLILAKEPFMDKLARNLLGIDSTDELSHGERVDSLREMVNILLGNFLTEAFSTDITFDLFSPMVVEATEHDLVEFFSTNHVYSFMADNEPVAITSFIGDWQCRLKS